MAREQASNEKLTLTKEEKKLGTLTAHFNSNSLKEKFS